MNKHEKSTQTEKVPCEICLKEIPKSEAEIAEASDYFFYFCGLDCYKKWNKRMSRHAIWILQNNGALDERTKCCTHS